MSQANTTGRSFSRLWTVFSYPKGLRIFFLTEMWERYGFYVLQGLIILYFTQHFKLSDTQSYAIMGSFSALAYIMPIIGGFLADRIIGYRHAVIAGGVFLCVGYSIVASTTQLTSLYVALAVITVGTGLLKPNVSSLLGTLYTENDPLRHSGFTIFYVGINLGTVLATFSSGYIVRYLGWHNSFASASAGMILAIVIFAFGTRHYDIYDNRPMNTNTIKLCLTYLLMLALVAASAFIIQHEKIALICFIVISAVTALIVLGKAFTSPKYQRNRILAFFILGLLSVIYWALYFQIFFSLNLFTLRVIDHHVLGMNLPTPVFIGIESVGIIIFGPLMGILWHRLRKAKRDPSTPMKFSIGFIMICASFILLKIAMIMTPLGQHVNPYWLIIGYLLIAVSELSLSAIGLAMVTELIPPALVGMMMGIWFVSLGVGGKIAGLFADYAAIPKNVHQLSQIETIYTHAFNIYVLITIAIALISLALTPIIKRLINTPETQDNMAKSDTKLSKKQLSVNPA